MRQSFIDRLRNAGIEPTDSDEIRLQKTLLVFASGLVILTTMLWLLLYWELGPQLSANAPFAFQLLLTANLLFYIWLGDFDLFRNTQLGMFLFLPFAGQWAIGNFINASGLSLWGLLGPIGAVVIIGTRESGPWFFAYLVLSAFSGFVDFFLADTLFSANVQVPTRTSLFFFGLNTVAISCIVYFLLRYASQERARMQQQLAFAFDELTSEQQRSERLLLNILPANIAERLKHSDQTIADGFADVTVMFADIVNFTKVAEGLTPQGVFSMLNRIFSAFDELAEKHGLEKIKTIGDAYMLAGGLNNEHENHTQAVADMALDMLNVLRNDFDINRQHLEMRIGIATGPVVAGVVGKRKFIYDLWGDTVNIASRLSSEARPGLAYVDDNTFRRLRQEYHFEAPLTLSFKGKGAMTVFPLEGRLNAHSALQADQSGTAT